MNLFEGVIGHDRVVQMLEREAERPAHAYLFTGPSGVGKATVARRFAGALLCPGDPEGLRRVDAATHSGLTPEEENQTLMERVIVDDIETFATQHRRFGNVRVDFIASP